MKSPLADPGAGTLMFAEAGEAQASVACLLDANAPVVARLAARLRQDSPGNVVTIARGSSDNACTYGRYLIEKATGLVTASVGLSVGSIYKAPSASRKTLCITVSQSGGSPDLLAAVRRAKSGGALVVGLINQPGSPLGALCDEVISLEAAPERSVAATKSCIASLAAFAWIVAEWTRDGELLEAVHSLPARLEQAWELDWSEASDALLGAHNLYVLGRGPGLGVAQEAALKLKETCGLHAEAFSAAEVVHGPLALVGPDLPVLCFAQDDESLRASRKTASVVAALGAPVLFAGNGAEGTMGLPVLAAHPAIEPILMLQSFYRAAANLSAARGFDPDRPPHLSKVTKTL